MWRRFYIYFIYFKLLEGKITSSEVKFEQTLHFYQYYLSIYFHFVKTIGAKIENDSL